MNLTNFALVSLVLSAISLPSGVGGWGNSRTKEQLSPAEAEIGVELGKIEYLCVTECVMFIAKVRPSPNPSWAVLVIISSFPAIRPTV